MRTFLALEIPPEIAGYLRTVIEGLAKRTEGVKWVRDEGIHITVKFLGEIEEVMTEPMREALAAIGEHLEPFTASLDRVDAFPSKRSARVIIVRLKEGVGQIQDIFSEVEDRLAKMDIERENRALTPHLTLGRRRVPKPFPDGDPPPIEERRFTVENLVLFKSVLTPGGAIYTPIWKIKLGGEKR